MSEIQKFGSVRLRPISLSLETSEQSVTMLVQVLADLSSLRDLYKKSHWQVTGPTFIQLHKLFDKHYDQQNELVDMIGERVQTLGGISLVMPGDVARTARVEAPPTGREEVPVQLSRLLEAHEIVIAASRSAAKLAAANDDLATNDLLVTNVLRTNEKQVWFVSQHLVDTPLVCSR